MCFRSLVLGSLEVQDLDMGDQVDDFTEEQINQLREQVDFYSKKYCFYYTFDAA